MAPIKFEKDMKDKLEKRTIQPSANAWVSLSQRLDNEEKKNNKKGFWRLGIAASVVGVLLVSNFFLNSKTQNNTNTILVEKNTKIDTLKTEIENKKNNYKTEEVIVDTEESFKTKSRTKPDRKSIKTKNYLVKNTNSKNITTNTAEATNIQTVKSLVIEESTITNKQPLVSIENDTKDIKTKKQNVLDHEINTLLANATKDITLQKAKKATAPIDYNGLLIAVEVDLDETFREKMFKVVKKGYKTVRESVAERNE